MKSAYKIIFSILFSILIVLGAFAFKQYERRIVVKNALNKKEIVQKIRDIEREDRYLNLTSRSTKVTLEDIGISIDTSNLEEYLGSCKYKCIHEFNELILDKEKVKIVINRESADYFLDSIVTDFKDYTNIAYIDFDKNLFYRNSTDATIEIDKPAFYKQFEKNDFLLTKNIEIGTVLQDENREQQKTLTESLVNKVTNNYLLIKYGRQPIYVQPTTLKSFVIVKEENNKTIAIIEKQKIKEFLQTIVEKYDLNIELEESYAISSIANALLYRAGDESPRTAVILPLKGQTETNGEITDEK